MRALVIEDERRLAENIARGLQQGGGFAVDLAFDGEDGLYKAEELMAKPFDMGELVARIKTIIRRSQGHAASRLALDTLELNFSERSVRRVPEADPTHTDGIPSA